MIVVGVVLLVAIAVILVLWNDIAQVCEQENAAPAPVYVIETTHGVELELNADWQLDEVLGLLDEVGAL